MPFRRPSFRLSRLCWQRHLLLVLGLVLAFRALAWPLDMAAHRPAPAVQLAGEECHAQNDQHAYHGATPLKDGALSNSADGVPAKAGDERVCQILCAVACAPLLLQAPALPVANAAQPRHGAPLPLPLGVVAPPDLPPPIA